MLGRPFIGITLGDPCGIGPEVVAKALSKPSVRRLLHPVLFGDSASFDIHAVFRRLPRIEPGALRERPAGPVACVTSTLGAAHLRVGRPTRAAGAAQYAALEQAIAAAKRGVLDALCTAPVSKEQISRAGIPFMGHTEVLARAFRRSVVMLMDGPRLRVALATNHLALADVPSALRRPELLKKLKVISEGLTPPLGRTPRIAVCGLNPHAGEGGLLGREEVSIIAPAVAAARRAGLDVVGPFAADGLFARVGQGRKTTWDVALAMYHDQGLVLAKALDFDRTVNVTLGLPLPRTSPDHGTAYDIAGKGTADPAPMVAALLKAVELMG